MHGALLHAIPKLTPGIVHDLGCFAHTHNPLWQQGSLLQGACLLALDLGGRIMGFGMHFTGA